MSYTAADITELDDVQHTRLRPAVNLGLDVLNTALREIVDNAIEEVADPSHGGSCVTITLHADGSVSVADDGRGLPVDSDPVNGKNGIVKTLGTARAGGKFSAHSDATSTGAGLNGIGAAAAVFISARTDVTVRRAGKTYLQSFGGGYPGVFDGAGDRGFDANAPFTRNDTQKLRGVGNRKPDAHGTEVRILFDAAVVPDSSVDVNEVLLRAHAAARMSPGVHLTVVDEGWPGDVVRPELLEPFSGPWGTDTLLDLMCVAAGTPVPGVRAVVEGRGEYTTGRGPTPFRWSLTAGPAEPATVAAFCNTVRTPGGGSHLTAAVKGLSEALGRSRLPHPRPRPGQGGRRPGGSGLRSSDRARRGYSGARRVLGLPGQDRGVVAFAERGDGAGRGTQRHHLGGQPRQWRRGVAVDPAGTGGRQGAAQRRGRQGPVPGGVEGQGPGNEPVAAAEAAAQPGDRTGLGRRTVPVRG